MSIYRAISRLTSSLFSKKVVGLSSVLNEEALLHQGLYLRPGTEQQRQYMLDGYLKATKALYPNGGHIFVGSLLAAEVLHYLDANRISYTVHSLVEMDAHLDIMPVVDEDEGVVRVFVEDDHLSYAAREERLLKVQALFSPQCVPMIPFAPDELADMKAHFEKVSQIKARIKRLRRYVLFYEMNTTFNKSFPIMMCQLKGRVSYCILSTEGEYEIKIKELQHGKQSDTEAKTILLSNTVQIYGSGPKHKKEILSLSYDGEAEVSPETKMFKKRRIDHFFKTAIGSYGLMLQYQHVKEVTLNE
jgi:hypothetical protein